MNAAWKLAEKVVGRSESADRKTVYIGLCKRWAGQLLLHWGRDFMIGRCDRRIGTRHSRRPMQMLNR